MVIKKLLLPFIILLGAFLRLAFLNLVPNAIGGDELSYVLAGKSILLSGHDLTGTWNPWSVLLFQYPPGAIQAEFPYGISIISSLFPNSLLSVRIIYALLSIGCIPLLYLIAKKLTHSTQVGLWAAFLMSINPWEVYIGRTAYEATPALFFFLASLVILISCKRAKILFALPLLLLAFYSYIGTKALFLPFVLIVLWYVYHENKKDKKYYMAVLGFSVALILLYVGVLAVSGGNDRTSDLLTPFHPALSSQVNTTRLLSMNNPISHFYENKYILYIRIITEKFLNIFSFSYLFATGDGFFSVGRTGVLYALDLPFLILGAFGLTIQKKRLAIFLGLLALCSIIPQLLHSATTTNFTPHIILLFPILFIVTAYGITFVLTKVKKQRALSSVVLIIIYLLLAVNFFQIYLFQFPLQGYFDFNLRVLSSYAARSSEKNNVIVYSTKKSDVFQKYLFYTHTITPETLPTIKHAINTGTYVIGNVTFANCPNETVTYKKGTIIISDVNCESLTKQTPYKIAQLKDSGVLFNIYNDVLCSTASIQSYIQNLHLSDFDIENLTNKKFCEAYIIK